MSEPDWQTVRAAYEAGETTVEVIAAAAGVSAAALYRRAKRNDWRMRQVSRSQTTVKRNTAKRNTAKRKTVKRKTVKRGAATSRAVAQQAVTQEATAQTAGSKTAKAKTAGSKTPTGRRGNGKAGRSGGVGGACESGCKGTAVADEADAGHRLRTADRGDMLRRLMRLTARQIEEIEARLCCDGHDPSDAERDARLIGALAKTLDVIAAAAGRGEPGDGRSGTAVSLETLRTEIAERLARLRREG